MMCFCAKDHGGSNSCMLAAPNVSISNATPSCVSLLRSFNEDIGMNIGWFSLYCRAHGHDVAAFEPNPVMFLRMCESLEYNQWGEYGDNDNSVSLWKYGVGVEKGFFNLTTGNNPGGSSFLEDRLAKKFRRTVPVEVTTLDTVAMKQGWYDRKVSMLKVDVEGFEPYVFEGGKRFLHEGHVEHILMESSVTDITKGKLISIIRFLSSG